MIYTEKVEITAAVSRSQGSWKWQKRGAISRYRWTGDSWTFVGYECESMRYDHACESADIIGRPIVSRILFRESATNER